MRAAATTLLGLGVIAVATALASPAPGATAAPLVWQIDNTATIGGHPVTVWGTPKAVQTEFGQALQFDGVGDAVLIPSNPLAALSQFTFEILFKQQPGGLPEERFVHIQEDGADHRVMVETRVTPEGRFALDTFILAGAGPGKALLDMTLLHPAVEWHWAALVFDGKDMRHFVDGIQELAGSDVPFAPFKAGRTSLGARQNKVHWFKGQIRELRVNPTALPAGQLQRIKR